MLVLPKAVMKLSENSKLPLTPKVVRKIDPWLAKLRNKLDVESHLILKLLDIQPNIAELIIQKQFHCSHYTMFDLSLIHI